MDRNGIIGTFEADSDRRIQVYGVLCSFRLDMLLQSPLLGISEVPPNDRFWGPFDRAAMSAIKAFGDSRPSSGAGAAYTSFNAIAKVSAGRQTIAVWTTNRIVIFGLAALLAAALIATAFLFLLALRPFVRPGDSSLVERARRDARVALGRGAQPNHSTFPIVMRLLDRNCVELRSTRPGEAGSYQACYDNRTGRKVEQRATVGY